MDIEPGHPEYEGIKAAWKEQSKPARLTMGGKVYRAIQGSDTVWRFRLMSEGEVHGDMYSSSSVTR